MGSSLRLCAAGLLLIICSSTAGAAFLRRTRLRTRASSNLTLRKRLHVNTLISDPGTAEIDWSTLYSFSTGNFSLPSALKYTPQGNRIVWGRTEYSIAFDSLTTTQSGGGRLTQFSESLTLAGTSVLLDTASFDFAIAPQATVFLRDDSGLRLGATAIARYDHGYNSLGATLSWSGATHSSASNPAGTVDAGIGFGHRIAAAGIWGKLTPHVNAVWERSTGVSTVLSVFEGVEYQLNDRLAFDLSGQHFAVRGGPADHQLTFGLTCSFGNPH